MQNTPKAAKGLTLRKSYRVDNCLTSNNSIGKSENILILRVYLNKNSYFGCIAPSSRNTAAKGVVSPLKPFPPP
jgi:hypothetical protein